jgi:hypothetical protein
MITVVKTNFGAKRSKFTAFETVCKKTKIRNLDGDRFIIFKLENGVMGL